MNTEHIASFLMASIFAVPVIIIGIVLCCGKGAFLIAGYNTASPKERAVYDEKALCWATGVLVLVIVGSVELLMLGLVLDMTALVWSGGILMAVSTAFGLIYINKSQRFRRK